ncbi:hypothetical protein [Gemmata sp.]|uniref:hypothetical protein n=1 Tax=Gemmata sp. TaxID=1914242 RepID=UPI003F72EFBA
MTRDTLTELISGLADAVLADWRWVRDDLNVSVLGMILYGFGLEAGRAMGLAAADVDAAALRCMTDRVGAAAKSSTGLVSEASTAARDKTHHPGYHELIGVGRTYFGVTNRGALVGNVYANFASVRQRAGLPEPTIPVFVNPLVMLLSARERQKGSPLTEAEALEVRDGAACIRMPLSQAERFYAALDARMPIPRLHPERLWEQWQAIRDQVA